MLTQQVNTEFGPVAVRLFEENDDVFVTTCEDRGEECVLAAIVYQAEMLIGSLHIHGAHEYHAYHNIVPDLEVLMFQESPEISTLVKGPFESIPAAVTWLAEVLEKHMKQEGAAVIAGDRESYTSQSFDEQLHAILSGSGE